MQITFKGLHLILYSIENEDYQIVLEDAVFFDPNYRIGDIIEVMSTQSHETDTAEIVSYEVEQVQKIVAVDKKTILPNEHKLYVKVKELREEKSKRIPNFSFIIETNFSSNIKGNQTVT